MQRGSPPSTRQLITSYVTMEEDAKDLTVKPDEQEKELGRGDEVIETESNPSGDMLDTLSHEELLTEAKKLRAINKRNAKKPDVVEKPKPVTEKSSFVTVEDFRRANRERARIMATTVLPTDSDEVKAEKAEIASNWKDIAGYVRPLNEDTPEEVAKAIHQGWSFWKHDPYRVTPPEDPSKELKTNTFLKSGGKPVVEEKSPSSRRKTVPYKEWYKSPEA